MPRTIDADAVTSILEEWEEQACDGTENDGSDGTTRVLHPVPTTTREMIDLIADQPTIEAEPVKHGRWVHDINNLYGCSECMERETMSPKKLKPYCPNCGAKMDKEENEDVHH